LDLRLLRNSFQVATSGLVLVTTFGWAVCGLSCVFGLGVEAFLAATFFYVTDVKEEWFNLFMFKQYKRNT